MMSQNKELTEKKLSALWKDKSIKEIDTKGKKIVMFSDIHLGDGGGADDFRHNHNVFIKALDHYKRNGFIVILLGDIEEFWQFDLSSIVKKYDNTVYKRFRTFDEGAFHRIFGNHDNEWGAPRDPGRTIPRKSDIASEAIKLKDKNGKARILLIHGHQGSKESDQNSWFSRFFVRIYEKIEPIIKIDRAPSATKSQISQKYEKIFYTWAKRNKVMVICGHSHRAIFASKTYIDRLQKEADAIHREILDNRKNKQFVNSKLKELEKKRDKIKTEEIKNRKIVKLEPKAKPLPCYFNTGCALFTDGGTAIEIDNDEIILVKWSGKNGNNIKRELFDSGSLSGFFKEIG